MGGFMNNRINDGYKKMDYFDEERRKKLNRKKADLVQRMVSAYKSRKRRAKIEKLMKNDNHWRGLS